MVEPERAGRCVGRLGPRQIRSFVSAPFAPAALAGIGAAALVLAQMITGGATELATTTLLVFIGIIGISALIGSRRNWGAAERLDLLSRALDAEADAVLIVDLDGRRVYANSSFDRLFWEREGAPLERIRKALSPDDQSHAQFRRLRSRAAVGARAAANLSLSTSPAAEVAYFKITVCPIAARQRHILWKIYDVTSQHKLEAMLRDERDKLSDLCRQCTGRNLLN